MKKLNLLIVGLLFLTIAKANGNYLTSELNLTLWDNSGFNVIIDNQSYNHVNNLYLSDLTPGIHSLRVVKTKRNKYGNGGFKQVLYSGNLHIPKNSNVIAIITLDRQLSLQIKKKKVVSHNNYTSQHKHNIGLGCNEYYGCFPTQYIMGEYEFGQLVNMLNETSFDSDKLIIVKQMLINNNLNTEQVTLLANQFTFDSNKLTFAKMAYSKTVDKQNYFLVSNVFTFSRSIQSLNEYINQYG